MNSRITIVLPNFNHAAYLPASIGAILSQTRPADEIIIIDDASTDQSLGVIEQLTAHHPAVQIVRRKERGGVVAALNAGLDRARGDVVAFLAADDFVHPEFLATMGRLMEAHSAAAFGCARVELRDHAGQRTGERPIIRPIASAGYIEPATARDHLRYADNFYLGQVTLYRTARLRELGGFDSALGSMSDGILQRRLAVRWGFVFVPSVLGVWRVHGSNYSVSSVSDPAILDEMLLVARRTLESEPAALYPPDYADTFERRLRFNSARLLAGRLAADPQVADLISSIIRGGRREARILAALGRLGALAKGASTAWLALRMRPFALSWVLSELISRATQRLQRADRSALSAC